ncbi:MAG: radical SAM protein [Candidatus Omnitrophica bacterium]|nr:radical SAM protein [Candidatus Omnitrophota bacterium]
MKKMEMPRRAETLHYFPTKVTIETGNICNLRCPLCPTGTNETKVTKGLLTFERFKQIIHQLGPTMETLDFFDWGEPFLNKDLLQMVRYTTHRYPHVRVVVSSNLNIPRFSEIGAEEVVRSGLGHLILSVDGATQAVYEKYRVGGRLEEVLRNIRWIVSAKRRLRSATPTMVWNFLVFRHNEHEVDQARAMARELQVGFTAGMMRTDCGEEIFLPMEERLKRDGDWVPENPRYSQYTHEQLSHRVQDCAKPWTTVAINWDGDVVPCGSVYDCKTYNYGNIFQQSFREIWNGERYRLARRALASRATGTHTVCETCKQNGFPLYT